MKVEQFSSTSSYNGMKQSRPDMYPEQIKIRKLKMYFYSALALCILFMLTSIVLAVVFGMAIHDREYMEKNLEECQNLLDGKNFAPTNNNDVNAAHIPRQPKVMYKS